MDAKRLEVIVRARNNSCELIAEVIDRIQQRYRLSDDECDDLIPIITELMVKAIRQTVNMTAELVEEFEQQRRVH